MQVHIPRMLCNWWAALRLVWLENHMETFFLKHISCKTDKSCPHFLVSLASAIISPEAHSVSSAVCCSLPVFTTLNHLILKFRSGRANLWWKIVIWDKAKSRTRSLVLVTWSQSLSAYTLLWPCPPSPVTYKSHNFNYSWNLFPSVVHGLCAYPIYCQQICLNLFTSQPAFCCWLAGLLSCFYCDCQMNALKHFYWSLSDPSALLHLPSQCLLDKCFPCWLWGIVCYFQKALQIIQMDINFHWESLA